MSFDLPRGRANRKMMRDARSLRHLTHSGKEKRLSESNGGCCRDLSILPGWRSAFPLDRTGKESIRHRPEANGPRPVCTGPAA